MTAVVTAAVDHGDGASRTDREGAHRHAVGASPQPPHDRIHYLESNDRQHPIKQHTLSAVFDDLNRKNAETEYLRNGRRNRGLRLPRQGLLLERRRHEDLQVEKDRCRIGRHSRPASAQVRARASSPKKSACVIMISVAPASK